MTLPVRNEFTLGNALSIITTLIAVGAMLVSSSLAFGRLQATNDVQDSRLAEIELKLAQQKIDHDLLIEIRSDMKSIRVWIDRQNGRQ